jgi:indolepyruvate ferredoxin oxidoreductase alpha subunit
MFHVLKRLKVVVNSDIGCYALGVLPPLSTTDTLGCMGASIGVAHGVNAAGAQERAVAVIGDSTFFHAGMPALLNVVYNKGATTVVVLDNRTTAMTGHQENPATGKTLRGDETAQVRFEELARAMGIKVVESVNAFDMQDVERGLKACLESGQPALLVSRGPCVFRVPESGPAYAVDSEICNGCSLCFRIGCPAIIKSGEVDAKTGRPKAIIDPLLCVGCDVCRQTCFRGAIHNTGDWSLAERYGGPEPAVKV